MAKSKTITITLNQRKKGAAHPTFDLNAIGLERYEVIGLLELAVDQIKRQCNSDTKNLT